jgi:hypothetical protein
MGRSQRLPKMTLMTHLGHESPHFVAAHAADPLQERWFLTIQAVP